MEHEDNEFKVFACLDGDPFAQVLDSKRQITEGDIEALQPLIDAKGGNPVLDSLIYGMYPNPLAVMN